MNAVLIPAYKPDDKLIALAHQLARNDDIRLVVVDDGSGETYKHVFERLPERALLISYADNKGKGGALKTGLRYIYERLNDCARVVTCDADGQHRYEDIIRVLAASEAEPDALTIGSRAFDEDVPLRSRFGNALTRQAFAITSGVKLRDTQTGLRAFGRECMRKFMFVSGDRYEYEINMLLTAARAGIAIREVSIKTVYIEGNQSSHFNPFKDSLRIYFCLFKFAISSLICFGVDYALFMLFKGFIGVINANILARIVSASINFTLNKQVVFKGNERLSRALIKYALLALIVLAVNTYVLDLLTRELGWWEWLTKPMIDIALFAINYVIQGRFVYRSQSM